LQPLPSGLVPRRYQSGELDYTGGQLKLKDWAFGIARRSTMRKARVALARRLAIIMHAMLRNKTDFAGHQSTRQETASSSRKERRPREGADDGVDFVASGQSPADCVFQPCRPAPSLPHQAPASARRTQASHGVAAGHACLAKLAQGTLCKILARPDVTPHKVRYYLERRDRTSPPKWPTCCASIARSSC
jgi:hypothetical protein